MPHQFELGPSLTMYTTRVMRVVHADVTCCDSVIGILLMTPIGTVTLFRVDVRGRCRCVGAHPGRIPEDLVCLVAFSTVRDAGIPSVKVIEHVQEGWMLENQVTTNENTYFYPNLLRNVMAVVSIEEDWVSYLSYSAA